MQFIEMTGKTLWKVIDHDDEMLTHEDLRAAGVDDASLVRVNRQGDIELRQTSQWDVIGGLLGNYEQRVRTATARQCNACPAHPAVCARWCIRGRSYRRSVRSA